MPRVPHLDFDRFNTLIGDDAMKQLAGAGGFNTPGGPTIERGKVEKAIAYADSVVEGYLRGRYPPGTTHEVLTQAASDIAIYRLRSDKNAAAVSKEVRDRHDDAMRILRDIQAGRQALTDAAGIAKGVADGPTGTVMTSIDAGTAAPERAPAVLKGWLQ